MEDVSVYTEFPRSKLLENISQNVIGNVGIRILILFIFITICFYPLHTYLSFCQVAWLAAVQLMIPLTSHK